MNCEICESNENVVMFEVAPGYKLNICENCLNQYKTKNYDENHMQCLNNSMWSENPATKILIYKILKDLGWNDLLDMMYLEDKELAIANQEDVVLKDANGNILQNGDNVTVIKDLEVKGAGKTIKRGTTVKNIRMCDVEGHVNCRVDGIGQVYLKAEFLKKI